MPRFLTEIRVALARQAIEKPSGMHLLAGTGAFLPRVGSPDHIRTFRQNALRFRGDVISGCRGEGGGCLPERAADDPVFYCTEEWLSSLVTRSTHASSAPHGLPP